MTPALWCKTGQNGILFMCILLCYLYIFAFSIPYFPSMNSPEAEEWPCGQGIQVGFRVHELISHTCLENAPCGGFVLSVVHFLSAKWLPQCEACTWRVCS